jgi:hypothetical protein
MNYISFKAGKLIYLVALNVHVYYLFFFASSFFHYIHTSASFRLKALSLEEKQGCLKYAQVKICRRLINIPLA